jgi:glycosyltransferase involved in cell wall biosynthesis
VISSTKKIVLFSRDDRTFNLFRKSWVVALNELNTDYLICNRGFGIFRLVLAVYKFIKLNKKIRVIFGTSEICLYMLISSKKDILVFTGLGRLLQRPGPIKMLIENFLRYNYRQQKIVALNPEDVTYLEDVFRSKIILLNGEGFDFKIGLPAERNKSYPIVIAYVGRLLKSKGVDRLVKAFMKLSHLNCELRLIGDFDFANSDSLSLEWLDQMRSCSNGKISCYGFVNNVRELLNDVDIYVSLSEREGLPFSVLEAIEAGCFIVLSPVPGHLSFSDLSGIAFEGSEDLQTILGAILADTTKYYNFDSAERLEICNARFGIQSIITVIKSKIL